MESVEVEVMIDLLVPLHNVRLPLRIARIDKVYAALPACRKSVGILVSSVALLVDVPLFLHAVCLCIVENAEGKVVEHSFHSVAMLHIYVFLDSGIIDVAVGDILIYLIKLLHGASERPVVLVVPIVELHSVYVAAVEEFHLCFDHALSKLVLAEVAHETVAREHAPVAGYIHTDGTEDQIGLFVFLAVDFHHITASIRRRCRPSPFVACRILFMNGLAHAAVAYLCVGRHIVSCESHSLAGLIDGLVCLEVYGYVGLYGHNFSNPSVFACSRRGVVARSLAALRIFSAGQSENHDGYGIK